MRWRNGVLLDATGGPPRHANEGQHAVGFVGVTADSNQNGVSPRTVIRRMIRVSAG